MVMSIIIIAVTTFSMQISAIKTRSKNIVYLTQHNLNCMEQLRQMCRAGTGDLLTYYGDDTFGSLDIETEVSIETQVWDNFKIYKVTLTSKPRDGAEGDKLVNEFVMTNIGGIPDDF